MMSQPGAIAIHILPNISRSKGNQTLKFGQLIEHEKYFSSKIVNKMFSRSFSKSGFFSKKAKLGISLDQQSKVLYSLFLL